MAISDMAASIDATTTDLPTIDLPTIDPAPVDPLMVDPAPVINPTIISDAMSKEWANMLGEPEQGTSWIERAMAASPSEKAETAEKKRRAVGGKMKTVTDRRGKEWRMPTAASVAEERAQKAPKGDPAEMAAKKAQPKTKPAPAPAKKSTRPASKPKIMKSGIDDAERKARTERTIKRVRAGEPIRNPALKGKRDLKCLCGEPVTSENAIRDGDQICGPCYQAVRKAKAAGTLMIAKPAKVEKAPKKVAAPKEVAVAS